MPKRAGSQPRKIDCRIGVIEEIADNIYSIKFVLQSLGYEVVSFSAGSRYLPALQRFKPHVVIVDMMIPGDLGYSVIRALRARLPKKLPVLAITAAAMKGDDQEVVKTGATDTLAKPYAVAELQKKLKTLAG